MREEPNRKQNKKATFKTLKLVTFDNKISHQIEENHSKLSQNIHFDQIKCY